MSDRREKSPPRQPRGLKRQFVTAQAAASPFASRFPKATFAPSTGKRLLDTDRSLIRMPRQNGQPSLPTPAVRSASLSCAVAPEASDPLRSERRPPTYPLTRFSRESRSTALTPGGTWSKPSKPSGNASPVNSKTSSAVKPSRPPTKFPKLRLHLVSSEDVKYRRTTKAT